MSVAPGATTAVTRAATSLMLVLALALASCADAGRSDGPASPGGRRRELRVFAAASLRPVFTVIEATYERRHRDVDAIVTYGSSSSLARQVADGAPADVFVAADERSMAPLVDAALVGPPVTVATNRLAVLVERGNPLGIRTLDDLGEDGVVVALCAPAAPCGRLASAWLGAAGTTVDPASLEANAGAVAAKVSLGEADAGIAYVTDAAAVADVEQATVPDDELTASPALAARYVAATVDGAPADADGWLALLRSGEGRHVFAAAGFGPP